MPVHLYSTLLHFAHNYQFLFYFHEDLSMDGCAACWALCRICPTWNAGKISTMFLNLKNHAVVKFRCASSASICHIMNKIVGLIWLCIVGLIWLCIVGLIWLCMYNNFSFLGATCACAIVAC